MLSTQRSCAPNKGHTTKPFTQRHRRCCRSSIAALAALMVVGVVGWALVTLTNVSVRGVVTTNLRDTLVSTTQQVPNLRAASSGTDSQAMHHSQDKHAHKRFAYFFYVMSRTYACAALQIIDRLQGNLQMNSTRIDIVVLHTRRVGPDLLRKMEDQFNVRTELVEPIRADASEPTWKESLTKLRAFQDWGYDRVMLLDADAVPMVNLEHKPSENDGFRE
ncbi:unnamed protein product [Phytophthora lilii]|uniref:Unnamed protein product n=1 Tax=Phytophthora lilii TaxID=2077276 RepID=A0A9W6WQE7_9STRA|nr:unnamed protein product [Phytophthora lilii]